MQSLEEYIKPYREHLNMSQFRFGLRYGVKTSTLSAWEMGKNSPRWANYVQLHKDLMSFKKYVDQSIESITRVRHVITMEDK